MKKTVLLTSVLVLNIAVGQVKADFTFGEPVNLGPIVNSEAYDGMPCISADGLELYFYSDRGGGQGGCAIWVSTRESTDNEWGPPENLGSVVNSLPGGWQTAISADGLELYVQVWERSSSGSTFTSGEIWLMRRAAKDEPWGEPVNLELSVPGMDLLGGPSLTTDGLELHFFACRFGEDKNEANLYVTMRDALDAPWGEPVNLGSVVNDGICNVDARISGDGLLLVLADWWACLSRPGGFGDVDMWMTRRPTRDSDWVTPVNLGLPINSRFEERGGTISSDGSMFYFHSNRTGGSGFDLWQVPIDPIVDLNGDGIVDAADMCIVVDNWGTDNQLCDVGPMPWGDGVVDVEDLIVLAEHLFEEFPPAEPVE